MTPTAIDTTLRDCVRDAGLPCQHPISTGGNCWDCLTCSAREAVREISLPLARLVLTLSKALAKSKSGHDSVRRELWAHVPPGPPGHWMRALHESTERMEADAQAALTAADELKL